MTQEQIRYILSRVDHTLLRQDATGEEVSALLADGIRYGCASVCISPNRVKAAALAASGRIPICTVIGFPNGTATTAAKAYEAASAVADGAEELDMVISVGHLREKDFSYVLREMEELRRATDGKLLKVIIETCLLTEEEKITMCRLVGESGADFIKTSTGFAGGGATPEDIALMASHRPLGLKIKAAGGISSLEDAEAMLALGADRLGTSRIVKIVKELEKEGNYHA